MLLNFFMSSLSFLYAVISLGGWLSSILLTVSSRFWLRSVFCTLKLSLKDGFSSSDFLLLCCCDCSIHFQTALLCDVASIFACVKALLFALAASLLPWSRDYSFKLSPINFCSSFIKFSFLFSIIVYPIAELAEGILIRAPLWWLIWQYKIVLPPYT